MSSRTQNVARNLKTNIGFQITNILIKFILRTVFIYILGKEYLGINGVFSNILTVLSLSELGLGTAIVYDMYKPIAVNDKIRENQLFCFYKYVYAIIGVIILAIGMCLIPFLKYIVSDVPNVSNIYMIYILQLLSTSASYFFAQYRSLFDAHQFNYINTRNNWFFAILKTIIQTVSLLLYKNYILFLVIDLAISVLSNYIISIKCKKFFPYINNGEKKIDLMYGKHVLSNAMSMFSIKVGITVVNATDNLIISSFISTVLVGIYSNYSMLTSVITASTMMISSSLQASVGNLCVNKNHNKMREVFEKVLFLYSSLYALICIGMGTLVNTFISVWAGPDYVLADATVFVIILNLYLTGVHQPLEVYIYADGMFKYFRVKPWIEAGINVIISILLVKPLGITGVFLGTTLSHLFTTFWYDALIVCRKSIHLQVRRYYKLYFEYATVTFALAFILNYLFKSVFKFSYTILFFIVEGGIVVLIYLIAWMSIFGRTTQCKYYINELKTKVIKKK